MEKLQIPTAVQELLDSINATKLNLGEIKIDKHPLVAQDLDRYIQINKISIDLNLPRTYIWYGQVLKDSEGNIVPSNLPTPEWMMGETETSTIRDENFNRILVPVVDEETNEPILNEDGSPMKVCQILFRYYKTFQGFMDVNHFAKKQNCRVINHTTASLIDAFERV